MGRSGERSQRARAIAALVVCAVGASPSAAGRQRGTHARVDLLSESPAMPPGGVTTLGLRFAIDDGWHIYWRNPGESGGAPTVTWTAPPELSVADLEWPMPTRFATPGDTTYGYEHAVLLLASVRAADQNTASTAFDVQGRVDYQICKDVCVKETAKVSRTLPIGPAGTSADADLFASARAAMPVAMPAGWAVSASVGAQEWVLDIDTGRPETTAVFFPYQGELIDDSAAQRIDARPKGLSLHLKKSRNYSTARPSLDGLLIRPGERAVEISAAVR